MAHRSWSLLAALLFATAALAGCTGASEEPPAADPAPDAAPGGSAGSGSSGGSDASAPSGSAGAPPAAPVTTKPAAEPVEDAGKIEGPFEKTWALEVPTMGFKQTDVAFTLTGSQPGAPATARIYFAFVDPEGKEIKHAIVGLGGAGDSLTWTFTNADMPQAGTYTIKAMAEPNQSGATGLPSFGVGEYDLYAMVTY